MIIYVVSRLPGSLTSFVKNTAMYREPTVEVRHARTVPAATMVQEQGLAIIDLSSLPDGVRPPQLCTPRMRYVLLVNRQSPLPFPWVEFARSGLVQLVGFTPDGAEPLAPLATILERLNNRLSPRRLARAVVQRNPRLLPLEDLVHKVLTRPWRIRRPTDLAVSSCIPEAFVRERCRALGLRRVEHFVTLVRYLAFEFLTSDEGLSPRRARLVVGILDPANFRRQRRRLEYADRILQAGR